VSACDKQTNKNHRQLWFKKELYNTTRRRARLGKKANRTFEMQAFINRNTFAHLNNISLVYASIWTQQIRLVRRVPNMKVIVLKDHGKLFANDVVMVRSGYMRNFLFPRGIAIYATEENLQSHEMNLTPQMQRDLEEKKKGFRIVQLLKKSKVIELKRETRATVVEAIGQRRELMKRIDLFELARIIGDHFGIMLEPADILQVYQPDVNQVLMDLEKEGIRTSGLYSVQFNTSRLTTANVNLNITSVISVTEMEKARRQRLGLDQPMRQRTEEQSFRQRTRRRERIEQTSDTGGELAELNRRAGMESK
jgi:ribosomal protein L9